MSVLEFRVEADVARVRFLRADVRERLEEIGLDARDVDRLVLVVDEIVSNSVEHAQAWRGADDVLELRLTVGVDRVGIEFQDPAVPPDRVAEIVRLLERCKSGLPPLDSERGRGLFLIDDGLEDVRVGVADSGVGLRLTGQMQRETA